MVGNMGVNGSYIDGYLCIRIHIVIFVSNLESDRSSVTYTLPTGIVGNID